ncbi:hypothetical protein HDU87_001596 [Geranomyces variabilis]|uniref:Uncharacterized protein n=1 Tax=Geranomyces variabilis TaxID=109894 RepID=A0AAD5TPP4_9FUNG|nr:hypothetical protein HDU87_001596 [Geranomyces variabilis]
MPSSAVAIPSRSSGHPPSAASSSHSPGRTVVLGLLKKIPKALKTSIASAPSKKSLEDSGCDLGDDQHSGPDDEAANKGHLAVPQTPEKEDPPRPAIVPRSQSYDMDFEETDDDDNEDELPTLFASSPTSITFSLQDSFLARRATYAAPPVPPSATSETLRRKSTTTTTTSTTTSSSTAAPGSPSSNRTPLAPDHLARIRQLLLATPLPRIAQATNNPNAKNVRFASHVDVYTADEWSIQLHAYRKHKKANKRWKRAVFGTSF